VGIAGDEHRQNGRMEMLVVGEKLWNGAIVTPSLAATYNAISQKIAEFEASGRNAPDHLLNGRHNLLAGTRAS
jgi:hypothetical protein